MPFQKGIDKCYLVAMFFRQKATNKSDETLIQHFRNSGDLHFVSELYTRYTSLVYGVCLKYLKDRDEAKDAVMHLFEKLPGMLKAHEVTHFRSWLYVSARNQCLMQIRSKKGKFTEELSDRVVESGYVWHLDGEPELEGDLTRLEKCIEELNEEQRQCVKLFFLDEHCYKDIVQKTGFNMNQVKSYIQNGKRNLKICMDRSAS